MKNIAETVTAESRTYRGTVVRRELEKRLNRYDARDLQEQYEDSLFYRRKRWLGSRKNNWCMIDMQSGI